MEFLKKLFSKNEPFTPAPSQNIPGVEPIVVHAIENLFLNAEDQKEAISYALNFYSSESGGLHELLACFAMSDGRIEDLPDLSNPDFSYKYLYDIFLTKKQAVAWVKSITKTQQKLG